MPDLFHISNILGLSLALALIVGYLIHYLRVPKVTGYLILGIALGPFGIGFINHEDIGQLRFISEVALGLIVFSIGGEFQISRFRKMGRRILTISLLEICLTLLCVSMLVLCLGESFAIALLLGIIAIATAPAATVLVLREFDSEGPVTNHILILVGLNNLACIVLFRLFFPLVKTAQESAAALSVFNVLLWPFCEVVGSLAIGFCLALIVILGEHRLQKKSEFLTLLLATIVMGIGIGIFFHLSPLLINLTLGATVANLCRDHKTAMEQIRAVDLPFYIVFFILAGASLHLDLIPSVGMIGIAYIGGRIVGKLLGVYLGAQRVQAPESVRHFGGVGMLAQAGIAIGLCLLIAEECSGYGSVITSTVLSSVVFFELLGPVLLRRSLIKSGEVKLINIIYKKGSFSFREFMSTRIGQVFGLIPRKVAEGKEALMVKHVMRTQMEIINEEAPFDQILKFIEHSRYNQFPVISSDGKFIGLIAFQEIRDSLYDETIRHLIIARDLAIPPEVTVSAKTPLEDALKEFTLTEGDLIPVVDNEDKDRLVGILRQQDALAAFGKKE
jgi:Kef-type K+ transport system membrane component KefB/predicted transcriptional regulator